MAVPVTFLTDWGGSLRALTHFLAVTFLVDGGLLKGTDELYPQYRWEVIYSRYSVTFVVRMPIGHEIIHPDLYP